MSKSTFSLPRSGSALALCAALALPGCQQASAPPAEPEPTPPVLQAGQLHYASNHPQLALLAVTEARPASVLRVELPDMDGLKRVASCAADCLTRCSRAPRLRLSFEVMPVRFCR